VSFGFEIKRKRKIMKGRRGVGRSAGKHEMELPFAGGYWVLVSLGFAKS